jgi:hypothetical protein
MMNQEDLLKKTGNILRELQDQYDSLALKPQKLSELELELFLANANFLTEHVQILKKVATTVKIHALPEHTDVNPKEIHPEAEVKVFDDLFRPDVETPTFEFIVKDQDKETPVRHTGDAAANPPSQLQPDEEEEIIASQDENIIQESNPISQPIVGNVGAQQSIPLEQEDEIGPEPFLVTRVEEPVKQQFTPQPQAAEPVSPVKHQPNLNEQLASKSPVVNVKLSDTGKPVITDLKSAINLNEKLIFTKDLFDGYSLAYAEAIDLLNKMPDFQAADKFLQANYAAKHQWASKPGTVEQFYELLHQRFPK